MKEHEIQFGTLHPDGSLTDVRVIKQSQFLKCPFVIMDLSHYREDGTCRCDDPDHRKLVMWKWGYRAHHFKGIPLRDPRP
jgi:hypothetical protein